MRVDLVPRGHINRTIAHLSWKVAGQRSRGKARRRGHPPPSEVISSLMSHRAKSQQGVARSPQCTFVLRYDLLLRAGAN